MNGESAKLPVVCSTWEVDAHWATVFRCSPDDLWRSAVVVTPHAGHLTSYRGVFLFKRRDGCRVSAPADLVEPLDDVLRGCDPADVFGGDALLELLGERVEQVIGPNWYGYVGRAGYRPATGTSCRAITEVDAPALAVLREACGVGDWVEASFDEAPPLFGCFENRGLVAASNLTGWRVGGDRIGVLTHPDLRGRGYGAAVASAAAERALRTTTVAEWRTRGTNAASIKIALRLGFTPYGENLAIRFR